MKKLIVPLCISWLAFISMAHAKISQFEPIFPEFHNTDAQRKASNQFYSLGEASFANNVTLPFYGVTALNPANEGLLKDFKAYPSKRCHFNFKLDPLLARQLKLLALPETGLVLVPRNWQDIQVSVGANGTGFALIMSPDRQQAINLYNSSLCVGCGMPNASLYFPELLKRSVENEFGGYKDSKKLIHIVHPSRYVAFFSYQIPGKNNKTHGVAKYQDDDIFNFQEIHITLDRSSQPLAGIILNFYQSTH